jgi:hypothetical protein
MVTKFRLPRRSLISTWRRVRLAVEHDFFRFYGLQ